MCVCVCACVCLCMCICVCVCVGVCLHVCVWMLFVLQVHVHVYYLVLSVHVLWPSLLALRKENGSHHSVCTLSRHKQHLHACMPCAHDVCVGYVLCVQLYSTKPQVVIDNHFVSFSHP